MQMMTTVTIVSFPPLVLFVWMKISIQTIRKLYLAHNDMIVGQSSLIYLAHHCYD